MEVLVSITHDNVACFQARSTLHHSPVCDLFQGLNLVHRDEVAVEIHELDGDLLELALGQQMALDALQRLMRVVVRLYARTCTHRNE
eukprot:1160813-Pelagomonas_calceolata.AAC.9